MNNGGLQHRPTYTPEEVKKMESAVQTEVEEGNKPTDPNFPARIFYDRSADPRTVSLDLTAGVNAFGLIRFDFAFPLDRRPEDRSWQFWFGFGQIF